MQVEGKANVYKIITGILANQVLIKSLNNIPILLHHGYFWKNEKPCILGMRGKRIKSLFINSIKIAFKAYNFDVEFKDIGESRLILFLKCSTLLLIYSQILLFHKIDETIITVNLNRLKIVYDGYF